MSLELSNVLKTYREPDGNVLTVLDIERFQIAAAEQVVLVGSSGGGKTSLLNIISGISTPDQGSVTIDGTEITRLPEVARAFVAYVLSPEAADVIRDKGMQAGGVWPDIARL